MATIGNESSAEVTNPARESQQEILVRRLGWSLPMLKGVERDECDNENAVYVVSRDITGDATACVRLLSTESACMFSDLFGDLLGAQPPPRDPAVWEMNRFAPNVRTTDEGRVLSLSQSTLDLLAAVLDFARQQAVKRLALVTPVAVERLLMRAGFDARRAAAPRRMPEGLFVALYIEVPEPVTANNPPF